MSTEIRSRSIQQVHYPDSDGKPRADNTVQFRWIQTLHGGLDALFRHDPRVFVAGDLLWYPVEGDNTVCCAPDVMVVFGRPKGDRGSYRQWEEDGIPPQVVFEIISPGNSLAEIARKFTFYQHYGVEEFYVYDPQAVKLEARIRQAGVLRHVRQPDGWISPRLGIRFDLSSGELRVRGPDGEPLVSYRDLADQRAREREEAARERERAERERERAEREAQARERLAAQLRALGIEPEA